MNHMNSAAACSCVHHKVVPVLIVLLGLTFLLQACNVLTVAFVTIAWPILVIVIGLVKLKSGSCRCYKHASS